MTRCEQLEGTLRDLCDWALELPFTEEFYEHLWHVIHALADDVWTDVCCSEESL